MSNEALTAQIISNIPSMQVGEFAVVGLSWDTSQEGWNTGRTYLTVSVAAARQTREINSQDCRAYIVRRHAAGYTVYLGIGYILGSVAS